MRVECWSCRQGKGSDEMGDDDVEPAWGRGELPIMTLRRDLAGLLSEP